MKALLMLVLLAAVAMVGAPHAAAAEELGRLFFTPQQRQDLDRRRAANVQEAATVVQESTLTLQGQVSRSGGKTTTWVNAMPLHDAYSSSDPARATIQTGEDGTKVELKVGQTFDRVRGETRDDLGGGRITVDRPRPAAR
jgi:hypothetical protein